MRTTLSIAIVLVPLTAAADPAPAGVAGTAPAIAAPWTIGLEPRVGVVLPTSKLHAMAVGGLEVDYALPVANHQLVVAADLSLTRPSYDGSVMDPRIPAGSGMYTIHETEMVVGLTLGYRFAPADRSADRSIVPFAAVGPVLHLLRTTETTAISPGDNTATSTELGFEVGAGADFRAGPGFVVGGARLVYSKLDHTLTGSTNSGTLGLELGYRLVF